MLTPAEFSRQCDERDRALKGGVTPLHSACEAGMDGPDDEEDQGEEVRRRVQYQADPVLPDLPEVSVADLGKRFSQAFDTPSGYPAMSTVNPEAFRRGPIVTGEAAYSPGHDPSARPVPGSLGQAELRGDHPAANDRRTVQVLHPRRRRRVTHDGNQGHAGGLAAIVAETLAAARAWLPFQTGRCGQHAGTRGAGRVSWHDPGR